MGFSLGVIICGSLFDLYAIWAQINCLFVYVGMVYLVSSRPRPNHRRSPALSRRRHHLGEPLVLIFFIYKKIKFLWFRYIVTCIIFLPVCCLLYMLAWFSYPSPSALVQFMIRMWYIFSFIIIYCILCLWQLCQPTWHECFYLGGMWTENSNRPSCLEVNLV